MKKLEILLIVSLLLLGCQNHSNKQTAIGEIKYGDTAYRLTYYLEGGTLVGNKNPQKMNDEDYQLPALKKSNYLFIGWLLDNATDDNKYCPYKKFTGFHYEKAISLKPVFEKISISANSGILKIDIENIQNSYLDEYMFILYYSKDKTKIKSDGHLEMSMRNMKKPYFSRSDKYEISLSKKGMEYNIVNLTEGDYYYELILVYNPSEKNSEEKPEEFNYYLSEPIKSGTFSIKE